MQVPLPLLTDSYKTTHYYLYPEADKMVAYGEFRKGYDKDETDTRIIFFGLRYIIDHYIAKPFTELDVQQAELFFKTHNAGNTEYPFPADLFRKFIRENKGYFPVKIEAMKEGSVIYPHVPVYQITATGEYSRLVTYLETLLTMVWYPCTVATLSKRAKDIIERSYKVSVDDADYWTLESRLHDFGFRGCTSVEQSVIGGVSHLINFIGTDTLSAAWYAQFHLNNGKPVANSIPATEHSVMTAHINEKEAMKVLLENYGSGVCACVMDSYDYTAALEKVLPSVASLKVQKGGLLVLRPDSGDPVQVVLQALKAADATFGSTKNSKGYKVLNGIGVIQGDGININTIKAISDAVLQAGFSTQNVAYGMGAGLLQKVNRDTMSFATKLSFIKYKDGVERDVMKMPKTDKSKISLPGQLRVEYNGGIPMVYPTGGHNEMQVVYDNGPVQLVYPDFDTIRKSVQNQWKALPPSANVISKELALKIQSKINQ